jgi:hypothetical protein
MSKAMTRKAWLEYLQKAADEFDWEAAGQDQSEPVAYIHRNEYNEYRLEPHDNFDIKSIPFNVDVPLFKEQRTWVGLTDEDDIDWEEGGNLKDLVKAIEAKLKEKNNG